MRILLCKPPRPGIIIRLDMTYKKIYAGATWLNKDENAMVLFVEI